MQILTNDVKLHIGFGFRERERVVIYNINIHRPGPIYIYIGGEDLTANSNFDSGLILKGRSPITYLHSDQP